jgi:putative ABC transport system substrate-binding protein
MTTPWSVLIVILMLGIIAAPPAAQAQPAKKVPRNGFLGPGSAQDEALAIEAFRKGLHELGWIDGHNIAIEWRWAQGEAENLRASSQELVGLGVDVLVSPDGHAVRSLKAATATIPIVMAGADRIVERGLVVNLARPGGNVTGVTPIVQELDAKRMELLKEVMPALSRVAVFRDFSVEPLRGGAGPPFERWGFIFVPIVVRGPDDFDRAFASAVREQATAVSMVHSPLLYSERKRLANLAIRSRLAWVAAGREYAEAGCLISYGSGWNDLIRRSAYYVDKILKGAKPADLPVEQPTKFEPIINRRTAKALGLTIPPSVLARADEIIQ